jgi:hypothetical protein
MLQQCPPATRANGGFLNISKPVLALPSPIVRALFLRPPIPVLVLYRGRIEADDGPLALIETPERGLFAVPHAEITVCQVVQVRSAARPGFVASA